MYEIAEFIGPRTARTILRDRKIRQVDGIDVFEDYFTDSSKLSCSSSSNQHSQDPYEARVGQVIGQCFTNYKGKEYIQQSSNGISHVNIDACEGDVEDNILSDQNEHNHLSKVRKSKDKINSNSSHKQVVPLICAVKVKQLPCKHSANSSTDDGFCKSSSKKFPISSKWVYSEEEADESVLSTKISPNKGSPFQCRDNIAIHPTPSTSMCRPYISSIRDATTSQVNAITLISDCEFSSNEEGCRLSRAVKIKRKQCSPNDSQHHLSYDRNKKPQTGLERHSLVSVDKEHNSPYHVRHDREQVKSLENNKKCMKSFQEDNSASNDQESDQSTSRQGCIIEKAYNCINDNAVSKVIEVQSDKTLTDEESVGFVENNQKEDMLKNSKRKTSLNKGNNSTKQKEIKSKNVSKKRKFRKIAIPQSSETKTDVQLRRSSRMRFAPFESWRNERLLYKFTESGGIETLGVSPGTADCASWLNIKTKEKGQKAKRKIIQKGKLPPRTTENAVSIIDTETEEITKAKIFLRSTSLEWKKPEPSTCKGGFAIARTFVGDGFIHGILKLEGMKKKPRMELCGYSSCFTVLRGTVEVIIHDSARILTEMDSFVVPAGNSYSLNNLTDSECLLSYAAATAHIDLD